MLEAFTAVGAALAGAVAAFAFQRLNAERDRRELLLRRYLAQLQDASESLWYRLENLAYKSASTVTDPEYLITTTMYTLGRALGIERMLGLEGLYPELWKRFPSLANDLPRRLIDEALSVTTKRKRELQHYDRVALAEAVVEWDEGGLRQSTFLEFRRRIEAAGPERRWWEPARVSVSELKDSRDVVRPLLETLKELALALAPVTKMTSPLAEQRDPWNGAP